MERVGSQQNIFPQVSWGPLASPGFLLRTSPSAISVKAEERGGFVGSWCLKEASPSSAVHWGQPWCEWVLPGDRRVGSVLLDVVAPSGVMLPSTLPPPAPCSHAALVSQPLPKHRDWEVPALRGHHADKASYTSGAPGAGLVPPCPTCRPSVTGQAVSLAQPQERRHPWGLKSARGRFPPGFLPPRRHAGCLPFLRLSSWRCVGSCFAAGLIHSPQNQIGLGSDPVRGLCCVEAHRNTKERSLVICSVISSFVP